MVLVDDSSCYGKVFLLHRCAKAPNYIQMWIRDLKRQYGHSVKILHTDGAQKFRGGSMRHFLAQHGIKHHRTVPETSQQNGEA